MTIDLTPDEVRESFWAALVSLDADESVHDMGKPYFDRSMSMVDCSGGGMPNEFFNHLARQLNSHSL